MNRLRQIRYGEKRMSQFVLRLETGIHQSRISLIENDLIEATKDEKAKMAKALDVNIDEIFPEAIGDASEKQMA